MEMNLNNLTAVSPVDGRYASKTEALRPYFSEFAFIRHRMLVEVEYFIALCELPLPQLEDLGTGTANALDPAASCGNGMTGAQAAACAQDPAASCGTGMTENPTPACTQAQVAAPATITAHAQQGPAAASAGKSAIYESLRSIYRNLTPEAAGEVKEIEKITNHDVKAVEYFIKRRLTEMGLQKWSEFVHFGLTSQDVNNTAQPLMLKASLNEVYIPGLEEVIGIIADYAETWKDIPMLAKTHGQPASPTRVGKELRVYEVRLKEQLAQLGKLEFPAKFGGATGNMNAHKVAFPDIDWPAFAERFVASLGLRRSFPTTQVEHYDNLAAIYDCLRRINTILIDFCRDIWTYISMEYFRQKMNKGEVGSSAMPHKVNPIDFENAEGNLGMANAILTFLSMKLPVSRLQRDLTDSTVMRNQGVPLAHGLIAMASLKKGLGKLILNEEAIRADLERNWAVVAEGIQTILRREGYPNPYETLKTLTRTGAAIDAATIAGFIDGLSVREEVKAELRAITPWSYTGF